MLGHRAHVGMTATAPGFYGAQGRPDPTAAHPIPDLAAEMAAQGVVNFEMEASALLVLAQLAGCRAGVVCTAFAQRNEGVFLEAAERPAAELACIETGMESLRILAGMDAAGPSGRGAALAPLVVDGRDGTLVRTYPAEIRQMFGSRDWRRGRSAPNQA